MTIEIDDRYLYHLALRGGAHMHPGDDAATVRLLEALELQSGQSILEIGCGTGRTLARLGSQGEVRVFGIDASVPILFLARRRLRSSGLADRVRLLLGRSDLVPMSPASVDRVFCESVLGFLDGSIIEESLREAGRILRPGGLLVANELLWRKGVPENVVHRTVSRARRDFGLPPATARGWHVGDWRELAEVHGFEVVSDDLLNLPLVPRATASDRFAEPFASLEFTRHLESRSRFHVGHAIERWRYRRRIAAVRPVGEHLEARLLVWRRQEGSL